MKIFIILAAFFLSIEFLSAEGRVSTNGSGVAIVPQNPFKQGRVTYRDAGGRVVGTSVSTQAGKTTYRDSSGRVIGTASASNSLRTTYRDASGRVVGTATKDANGKVTYRDASGKVIAVKK